MVVESSISEFPVDDTRSVTPIPVLILYDTEDSILLP